MGHRRTRLRWLAAAALAGCAPGAAGSGDPPVEPTPAGGPAAADSTATAPGGGPSPALSPEALFESTCSSCHDLALPRSLRLDRAGWEEVVQRMVDEFGATWITEEETRVIVEYLTEHYGPGT